MPAATCPCGMIASALNNVTGSLGDNSPPICLEAIADKLRSKQTHAKKPQYILMSPTI